MSNHIRSSLFLLVLLLAGCSGSDVYQGRWKATDADGNKFEIFFEPKSFSVKNKDGKSSKFEYTQNSIKIENSVKTYGIKLSDGRSYNIFFPLADDTTKGVITLQNNEPVYTISRKDYIQYDDIYKLVQ